MVLYLIGLGLGDEKDITVKGLEAVRKCKAVYLEHYTAILGCGKERLEAFYGVPVILADRECVENSDLCGKTILADAQKHDTAFLVVGDPLAATTHTDLMLRAAALKVECVTIHNTSIFTAVACCGLQLYQFGQTVSIPFFNATWRPDSFYEKIKVNLNAKFHTLCLLDIKVKEQTNENLAKGIKVYEPPRFMSIPTAIEQLLEVEEKYKLKLYNKDTLVIGVARLGQPNQKVVSGTMAELSDPRNVDWGGPLHSLVIPGECHFIESDMIEFYHWNKEARAKAKAEAEAKQHAASKAGAVADRVAREAAQKAADAERAAKAAAEKERLRAAAAAALKSSGAAAAAGAGAGTNAAEPEIDGDVSLFD